MDQQKEKIEYFTYCRKSSEQEERQALSIDSQDNKAKELFGNLKVIEILKEEKSAFHPYIRPVFAKMIERIRAGEAQGIIAWHPDRLSRNEVDAATITYMLRTGELKDLKFGSYNFDNSPEGIWMLQMALSQSQYDSAKKGRDVKRGLRDKVKMGCYPSHATLGYMNNPLKIKGEREITKDPERFNLVRKAWDLMLTGIHKPPQIQKIAHNEWGLRNKKGGEISRSTWYRIFSDPFYYGEFEYPKGTGNWYQGKHKPMITKEEFDRVQVLRGKKEKARLRKHTFAFTGLIRCGECGAMITAEIRIKKQKNGNVHQYIYYRCTKRKGPCSQKHIRKEKLKEQIVEILNKIEIPPEFHDWAMEQLQIEAKREVKDRNKILVNHQKAYNNCLKEIDGVISMRAKKELDEENYKRKMAYLTEEKAKLQELLNDTDNRVNNWIGTAEKVFAFARDAKKEFETGDLNKQKQILSNLGSNLLLKDQKLQILIQKPLILIGEAAKEVKSIHAKVRTSKNGKNKRELAELYSKSPMMLPWVDDVRTYF